MPADNEKLWAIFIECGCELKAPPTREGSGVVIVPHKCIDHGGYYIGEDPYERDVCVLFAPDDEVRQIVEESLDALFDQGYSIGS